MCFRPAGAAQIIKCPDCGFFNKPTNTSCQKCGRDFSDIIEEAMAAMNAAPATPGAAPTAPGNAPQRPAAPGNAPTRAAGNAPVRSAGNAPMRSAGNAPVRSAECACEVRYTACGLIGLRRQPQTDCTRPGSPPEAMPRCTRCSPTCQRCHRKPGFKFPVQCPVCGRYNPAHWEQCKRCGAPVPKEDPRAVQPAKVRSSGALCFKCDPLKEPLCRLCVAEGRIKVCPQCGGYVLGTRKDCKHCGFTFT